MELYEKRLNLLDIPSMAYRRVRGEMIEVWKYLHEKYDANHHFFRLDKANTRGHRLKLKKPWCNKSVQQHFFTYYTELWQHGTVSPKSSSPHQPLIALKIALIKHGQTINTRRNFISHFPQMRLGMVQHFHHFWISTFELVKKNAYKVETSEFNI